MTTKKTNNAKNRVKSSVNKKPTQVIKQSENIEKCPQKSSENACVEQNYAEEMTKTYQMNENLGAKVVILDTKDIVKDTILRLRNRFAYRSVISADEFKSALNEIENAIK